MLRTLEVKEKKRRGVEHSMFLFPELKFQRTLLDSNCEQDQDHRRIKMRCREACQWQAHQAFKLGFPIFQSFKSPKFRTWNHSHFYWIGRGHIFFIITIVAQKWFAFWPRMKTHLVQDQNGPKDQKICHWLPPMKTQCKMISTVQLCPLSGNFS